MARLEDVQTITVERIGINIDDCRIPDNAGQQIIDEPVFADGPAAYFSNLPIKGHGCTNIREKTYTSMQYPIRQEHLSATMCYMELRHIIETKYPGKRSGFIHIPFLPEQVIDKTKHSKHEFGSTIVEGLMRSD